jgi:hypothetical protein
MKRYMQRRTERALMQLAAAGALRLHPTNRDGFVWLTGQEGGPSSSVLVFDLRSGKWQDTTTRTTGQGIFAAARRLAVSLEAVTAALVSDALNREGGIE